MFVVSVGSPYKEVEVAQFETHEEALEFASRIDSLLGVDSSKSEFNEMGVCAFVEKVHDEPAHIKGEFWSKE